VELSEFWPVGEENGWRFFPDVPTLKELGYDAEFYIWAAFSPPGNPPAVHKILVDGTQKAMKARCSSRRWKR